jgi:hypothetical protein
MASSPSNLPSEPSEAADRPQAQGLKQSVSVRKNTSFKITNILPSRPPSHDPEESGDDDPDDSHTEDISDHYEHVFNSSQPSAAFTARGRFNILPCPPSEGPLIEDSSKTPVAGSSTTGQSSTAVASTVASEVAKEAVASVTTSSSNPVGNPGSSGVPAQAGMVSSSQGSLVNTTITATAGVTAELPNSNR